jgi:hypothetical protein
VQEDRVAFLGCFSLYTPSHLCACAFGARDKALAPDLSLPSAKQSRSLGEHLAPSLTYSPSATRRLHRISRVAFSQRDLRSLNTRAERREEKRREEKRREEKRSALSRVPSRRVAEGEEGEEIRRRRRSEQRCTAEGEEIRRTHYFPKKRKLFLNV